MNNYTSQKSIGYDAKLSLLSIGERRIAVPQKEVVNVLLLQDAVPAKPPAVGQFEYHETIFPVYAFTAQFELLASTTSSQHYAILIVGDSGVRFSLCCDNVESLSVTTDMDWDRVPDCMRLTASPLESFLYYDNQLIIMTDAQSLWRWIEHAGKQHGA